MKRVYGVLVVVALIAAIFSQVSCNSGGPMGNGRSGIQVGVAAPGTRVYLDGHSMGTVVGGRPGPTAYVAAGAHKLTAQIPGYEPFEMTVYGYPGSMQAYDLPLADQMTPIKPKK